MKNTQQTDRETSGTDTESENEWYGNISKTTSKPKACNLMKIEPQFLEIEIEGRAMEMEIDRGSEISLINERDCNKFFPNKKIEPAKVKLIYFGGERRNAIGLIRKVTIKYGRVTTTSELYVVGKYGN